MALAIATNNAALNAAASASSVNRDMETSMARLSSGKRINSASDDAAGVAIASRLSAEIRGTDQAIRNSLDGQALIDTAEGAHKEIENILQRMREVAVQAANDTNNGQDRANLQAEMDAMITEIDRIAKTTTWAGTNLMQSSTSTFEFQVGTATGDANQIEVNIGGMTASNLGLNSDSTTTYNAYDKVSGISTYTGTDTAETTLSESTIVMTAAASGSGETTLGIAKSTLTGTPTLSAGGHKVSLDGIEVALTGGVQTDIDAINAAWGDLGVTASMNDATDADFGADAATGGSDDSDININTNYVSSANNSQYIKLSFKDIDSPENLSVMSTRATNNAANGNSNDTTSDDTNADANARTAIGKIDTAIMSVNNQRSELGAVSNRLNHTVNNLTNISSNLSAAKGGIEDADFALETTNLAKNQILQQASTAMLAQANASKQNVLSLLQG